MKDVNLKGYVKYEDDDYTFIYENKKLTLVSVKNKFSFFREYKFVEEFKGVTLDGFKIIFYINKSIYYKDGCFICSPRCMIIARDKSFDLENMKFKTLKISGGDISRFYSNRNMIDFDEESQSLKFKKVEETVTEEIVTLNKEECTFELSIMEPGWKYDGIITFDRYDSLLRIKYSSEKDYKQIIKDLNTVDKFFKFCTNRVNVSFDEIFLETVNKEDKYENIAEIFIPYMVDNEANKDMLDFNIFKDHLNQIFCFLENCNYIFSIIPNNNDEICSISNKKYCAAFSCFESIYQFTSVKEQEIGTTNEEIALTEVKNELIPLLEKLDEKYIGKSRLKREFIKRFIHLVSTVNLNLEKNIKNELEKNIFITESIYYKRKDEIKQNGLFQSIIKAVKDRDDITHNKTIRLDNISIGIYEMILKLNYVMIFNYIGISKDVYSRKIQRLGLANII